MKKIIIGAVLGFTISASSIAFASESIQALLFAVKFQFNGQGVEIGEEYKVLNYDGHTYVPIRFVAENIGAAIDYDTDNETIVIKNGPLDIKDPNYKGISVGNLILTKDGKNTKVIGQLKMENMGNEKNMVGANLSFYNEKDEEIGEIAITRHDFSNEAKSFEAIGVGDFRAYSAVKLHIGVVNGRITGGGPY
ncbi:MAG: copper amine oxidase-like protein [Paenibacillus sp.]|jgi:hypothetical protein|nr:copper amine oxidase-like protein [Paenibacillus sp.]